MPSIIEISAELSRIWPELNREGPINREERIRAIISQLSVNQNSEDRFEREAQEIFPNKPTQGATNFQPPPCQCRTCIQERKEMVGALPKEATMMIVCEHCGNKRCPHANDHRNQCTNSNAPNQPGSAY